MTILLSPYLWEKYRQQILEKNIVNKSVRTAAADSWRGDIIEFPINGPHCLKQSPGLIIAQEILSAHKSIAWV